MKFCGWLLLLTVGSGFYCLRVASIAYGRVPPWFSRTEHSEWRTLLGPIQITVSPNRSAVTIVKVVSLPESTGRSGQTADVFPIQDGRSFGNELISLLRGFSQAEREGIPNVEIDPSMDVFNFFEKLPSHFVADRLAQNPNATTSQTGPDRWSNLVGLSSMMSYYLGPYLPQGCRLSNTSKPDVLTIHLRTPYECTDKMETGEHIGEPRFQPHYRQPPCSIYEDILTHGRNQTPQLAKVEVITAGPDSNAYRLAHPCVEVIVNSSNRLGYDEVRVFDSRELSVDVCALAAAHNLVLSTSSFAATLALFGSAREKVLYSIIPRREFSENTSDEYLYYGLGAALNNPGETSYFQTTMCKAFGDFIGFIVPQSYFTTQILGDDPDSLTALMKNGTSEGVRCRQQIKV